MSISKNSLVLSKFRPGKTVDFKILKNSDAGKYKSSLSITTLSGADAALRAIRNSKNEIMVKSIQDYHNQPPVK